MPAWPATPVTLLGDACHLAPGFGGNLAMQDATFSQPRSASQPRRWEVPRRRVPAFYPAAHFATGVSCVVKGSFMSPEDMKESFTTSQPEP
jgi:hypothetical protein